MAIDGTNLKASAGWGRGRSPAKMSEEEQKLSELVQRWMEEAERTDAAEDDCFGKGRSEESLPEKLATAKQRLAAAQENSRRVSADGKRGKVPRSNP